MHQRKMIRLKISSKVLIYFLVIALLPLFVVTTLLVNSAKSQLLDAAKTKQQIIANKTAESVDNFLADKINLLVFQSRDYSIRKFIEPDSSQNLAVLIRQDADLEKVSLLDPKGVEKVAFNKQGPVSKLTNYSDSDAYNAVIFLKGREFVSSVSYNKNGDPLITIAVPLLENDFSQNLDNLSQANLGIYKSSDDIKGILLANYNISDLWQSVLSTKIGQGGYAYVVDGLGNLVAHPNKKYLATHQKIAKVQAVSEFINGQEDTRQTVSEVGLDVISTPHKLVHSGWAVIVEEPVTSVYAGVNSFIKLSAIIILSAAVLSIITSLIFRNQLLIPIRKLTFGAKKLGSGDFDHKIAINSNDELRELATTFNNMGLNIKQLVSNLESRNVHLFIEQTKLNGIIGSVSDGIIALNAKGEIVTVNPPAAKLINKQAAELYGKIMTDLYPWERESKHFAPELQKPGLYHYTDLVLPRGSDVLYLDLMVTVIEQKQSEVAAIISIHDQTQARELDYMKLDFVAIAAHELRTPLTVIQGYLSLLNADAIKQLTIYNIENLQKAITGTTQLRNLINKLLSIARIERGEMEINIGKLDLPKLVKEIVGQHATAASQKEQRIAFNSSVAGHVFVPGDISSLSEVLNNLIGNALKFTEAGGTVQVNLKMINDMVRVEVVDDGPGVPTELRARLFTKFYRVERSLIAGSRGTGLGLYISKTIIELHHGKIGIEPYTGKGSTFYFTLPIYDPKKHGMLISNKKEAGGIHGWFKKRATGRR